MQYQTIPTLSIAFCLSSLAISPLAEADINTGLVAHYSFDDCTAQDSGSSALHGTIQGVPTCVNGKSGKALSFNSGGGQGDYIVLPTIGAVFKKGVSNCAWVQFTKNRFFERIIDLGNGQGLDNIVFHRAGTTNALSFTALDNNGNAITAISADHAITNASWKHYCFTQDVANSTAKIYVNGKLQATSEQAAITNVVRTSNFIAHSNWSQDTDFKGLMDEVRLYNRALSAADIQTLYYQGIPVSGSIKSLAKHSVTCANSTTAQSVTLPVSSAASYDCEAAGLTIKPGDNVVITVSGPAR